MLFIMILLYFFFIGTSTTSKNQLLIDYFNHKHTPSIIGFSCNKIQDNFSLIKSFSRNNISLTLHKLSNTTSIVLMAQTIHKKLGIFLDVDCFEGYTIVSMFSEATNNWLFDELRHWLIISSEMDRILEVIDDRSFGVSTDLVISVLSDDSNVYELYDVYNICKEHGGKLNLTLYGSWNESKGITVELKQDKFSRRANVHSLTFRTMFLKLKTKPANVSIESFMQKYTYPVRENQHRFGFGILNLLSELYNFSMASSESQKPQPGEKLGATGRALVNNVADFTGTPLVITQLRTHFMKFIHPNWPYRTCFLFRNPQPKTIKVLRPLKEEVWHLMAILMIVSLFILAVLLNFESHDVSLIRYSNLALLIISAICGQSTSEQVSRMSTRIAYILLLLYSLIIFNYYSSSFVFARLDNQIFKINDSLTQLGKLHLKMRSEMIDYLKILLQYPDWETRTFAEPYWSKIPETDWYNDPEIGMRLVQQGGFAYHTLPDVAYPYVEKLYDNSEICEMMEVHLTKPKLSALAIRYNSIIVEMARVGLTKILEVGLRHQQVLRWHNKQPVCRRDMLSSSSIEIHEFAAQLILLSIGMCFSVILCVTEIVIFFFGDYLKLKIAAIGKGVLSQKDLNLLAF